MPTNFQSSNPMKNVYDFLERVFHSKKLEIIFDRFAQTENGGDFQSGKSTTICSNNKPQNEQTLSGLTYLGV